MSGGCITQQWGSTFTPSDQVVDLLTEEPHLMEAFERLYARHARQMPRFLHWGETVTSVAIIDKRRLGKMLTSCTRNRGLQTSCWVTSARNR